MWKVVSYCELLDGNSDLSNSFSWIWVLWFIIQSPYVSEIWKNSFSEPETYWIASPHHGNPTLHTDHGTYCSQLIYLFGISWFQFISSYHIFKTLISQLPIFTH